jgi:UTP--glucose-1-phosphate uridylyltransferase
MVEKPAPGTAPSNLAVIGRYILNPRVLGHLEQMRAGAGGEIQLTDAIAEEIRAGIGPRIALRRAAVRLRVKSRVPAGDRRLRLARPDLRDEFTGYLREIFAIRNAAQ